MITEMKSTYEPSIERRSPTFQQASNFVCQSSEDFKRISQRPRQYEKGCEDGDLKSIRTEDIEVYNIGFKKS